MEWVKAFFTLCKYGQKRPRLRRREHDFHKAHCSTYWSFISVKDLTGQVEARMRKQAVRSHPVCFFQKLKDRDSEDRWPTHSVWLRQAEHDDNRQSCLSARHKTLSVCLQAANWVIPAWVITLIRNLLTSACTRAVNNLQFLYRWFYKSRDQLTIPPYFPIMTNLSHKRILLD